MALDHFSRLHRQRIDDCLSAQLESLPAMAPRLRDAMSYGLLLGGKRVRPFLVYAVGEMLGVKSELLDGPAAAVECIHAYSLLHDDLPAMDNDDLRRGQP
ncbi:polyprenyl synthetase family protein, partial [Aeromonas sp. CPF2-S1]|nr:polyprenyl synthetase family protein [Aeromonas sp. CPF2-S1]